MTAPEIVDYVVVGAGSAGAVVAARLSERPQQSVALLEAGPPDDNQAIHIPLAFAKLFRTPYDWDYATTRQPALAGREIYWPRGRTLGGSSSLNAMMWVRGFAADYDEWAEHAGPGWSFTNLLPLFRRIEDVEDSQGDQEGRGGPLRISQQRDPRPLTAQFLAAAAHEGFPIERANPAEPRGFSQTMVTQADGARCSTAIAYLRPAAGRENLTVLTGAHATRVIIDGSRATAVEYDTDTGRHTIRAAREIILCGGAVNTPQLLMLSGIGDAAHLADHGIRVQHHAPEVGRNLLDHLVVMVGWTTTADTLYGAETPEELDAYVNRQMGKLTSNIAEAYGFVRSRKDLPLPDLELLFGAAPFYDEGLIPAEEPGAVIGTILLKPRSTGEIRLRDADPHSKPIIDPRYLTDPDGEDLAALRAGVRLSVQIAEAPPLKGQLLDVTRPGDAAGRSADEVVDVAIAACAHTLYHPTTTCRMGTDPSSVVDEQLRVRGVSGLRVADASVMPTIIRGHTHAPSVVIGEKAVQLIQQ